MSMVSDRVLSPAELRALSGRGNAQGARRLVIHVALLAGTGWLAACPSLLNLRFCTAFHFAHHRHTQIPRQDPELDMEVPNNLRAYVRRILGAPYRRLRLLVIADCWRGDLSRYPYVSQQAAPSIIRSVRAMSAVMVGGSLVSGILVGWETPFVYWILPQLLCQPFLRAYVLAEHTGCAIDRNGLTNTRTTLTNAAVRLLMCAVPRRAPSVSIDPIPPPGRCAHAGP
jgi:fatty acid desaturase